MQKIKQYVLRPLSLGLFALFTLASTLAVWNARPVEAAACQVPSTTYGTATTTINVTTAGTYTVWSRIMAPDANNNSYMLEIDGNTCYTVGNSAIPANNWAWVDYQGGNTSSKITASFTAGSHTVKLIGTEPNVKVDRILAISNNCTPTDKGDNCTATVDTTTPKATITAPSANTTISGTVNLTATATDNIGVSKVDFLVDGKLQGTDTSSPYTLSWDSSKVANGLHTISVTAYDAAGNTDTVGITITTKNGDTQAPSTPTGVKAETGSGKMSLSWTASTDNTEVKSYKVLRNGVLVGTSSTTTYVDLTAAADTKYSYQVQAVDAAGNVSPASAAITATLPKPADTQAPSVPQSLSGTAASKSQINLRWNTSTDNVGVIAYDVYRATGTGTLAKIGSATTTSFGDTGLTAATAYSYTVTARDAAGNVSGQSAKITVSTMQNTPTPTEPPTTTGTLKGRVSGRWWRPLQGAKVIATKDGKRYTATTNKQGVYQISSLPAGRYEIKVSAEGYSTQYFSIAIKEGKTVNCHVQLGRWWGRWWW